jgi:hypothetical protein
MDLISYQWISMTEREIVALGHAHFAQMRRSQSSRAPFFLPFRESGLELNGASLRHE